MVRTAVRKTFKYTYLAIIHILAIIGVLALVICGLFTLV